MTKVYKLDRATRDRIGWWKLKAQRHGDPFVRFVLFWFCFNAWMTALSGKDYDREAIKWFLKNDSCLKASWPDILSSTTKSWLRGLKRESPVYDMRPGHKGEKREWRDIDNFEEMIWFIYQIRCNLFHGSKDPMDPHEQNLVELSEKILGKWIVWAFEKCDE